MAEQPRRVLSVDAEALPKHFEPAAAERRWDDVWQESGRLPLGPGARRAPRRFVVDTPPPTVSGSLHVGPRVQLHAHRRHRALPAHARAGTSSTRWAGTTTACPPSAACRTTSTCAAIRRAPYEPEPRARARRARRRRKEPPRAASRARTSSSCASRVTREDEEAFKELWRRLGLSVDWRAGVRDDRRPLPPARAALVPRPVRRRATSTASRRRRCGTSTSRPRSRRPRSRTAPTPGAFHDIAFARRGRRRSFVIATTRPELLAACVGVTAHPGRRALPARSSASARSRRSSACRCRSSRASSPTPRRAPASSWSAPSATRPTCMWWREQRLALRQIVGRERPARAGRRSAATGFASRDAGGREPRLRRARRQDRRAARARRSSSCCATRRAAPPAAARRSRASRSRSSTR